MKKFEYRTEKIDLKDSFKGLGFNQSSLDEMLKNLGTQGWELVSCVPAVWSPLGNSHTTFFLFVFKREI